MRRAAACAVACLALLLALPASATPFYAVDSASRCNTCHVEPLGWANPARHRDRRCTLDCSGCHLSPTGGGARTPLGRYYGEEVLPMWGRRPSEAAEPERFLPDGYPTEGRYQLFEGFEGWWAGEVEFRTIDDRYGSITPSPVWQAGGDVRTMAVLPTDRVEGREFAAFPMEAQVYLAAHPLSNLTAYLDVGYLGSVQDGPTGDGSGRDAIDVVWLRELHLMVHDLPHGAYARVGRFALPYGWRLPDHTAYSRRGMFDQYRQGYGAEVGAGANYGWGNLAVWRQGIENWPGDTLSPGAGVTAQGGVRMLGWQLGASMHVMQGRDGTADERMFGPMWAINAAPLTYLGELAWRRIGSGGDRTDAILQLHELRYVGIRGFTPKVRWEWEDANTLVRDDARHRMVLGFEWNPVRYLQMDVVYRREWVIDQLDPSELLFQVHAWIF